MVVGGFLSLKSQSFVVWSNLAGWDMKAELEGNKHGKFAGNQLLAVDAENVFDFLLRKEAIASHSIDPSSQS